MRGSRYVQTAKSKGRTGTRAYSLFVLPIVLYRAGHKVGLKKYMLIFKKIFIYFFILAALGLSCSTWTLSCGMRVGSSSPIRD